MSSDRLTLDLTNVTASRTGDHGLPDDFLVAAAPQLARITEALNASAGSGWERWRSLPHDPVRSKHLTDVRQLVDRYRDQTENLVVLGIGGSALGNSALHQALRPHTWNLTPRDQRNGPRLFVLDNVDPDLISHTLQYLQRDDPGLHRTLFNVISKSGETAETAAQFLMIRSLLHRTIGSGYPERIVAITDPEQGTMAGICDREGYARLPVPEGVGGRFSVLSPVGLFSAAMCGIDIESLLSGAAEMDVRCRETDVRRNPAAALALVLVEFLRRGRPMHVLMPYANALYGLADWYRQLWAESLGKMRNRAGEVVLVGPTPIKALGATDQHSQIQLYREGPHDKVIGFIEVQSFDHDPVIPGDLDVEALRYLGGRSLRDLLLAEFRATQYALCVSGRPNYVIRIPRITPETIGAFIQLWQVATAYAGAMLGIDPYDQPAVETGKQATFGLMGRPGFESWRDEVDSMRPNPEFVM